MDKHQTKEFDSAEEVLVQGKKLIAERKRKGMLKSQRSNSKKPTKISDQK